MSGVLAAALSLSLLACGESTGPESMLLSFASISVGSAHACGLTPDGLA